MSVKFNLEYGLEKVHWGSLSTFFAQVSRETEYQVSVMVYTEDGLEKAIHQ